MWLIIEIKDSLICSWPSNIQVWATLWSKYLFGYKVIFCYSVIFQNLYFLLNFFNAFFIFFVGNCMPSYLCGSQGTTCKNHKRYTSTVGSGTSTWVTRLGVICIYQLIHFIGLIFLYCYIVIFKHLLLLFLPDIKIKFTHTS